MSVTLGFDLNVSGQSALDRIPAVVAAVGKAANSSAAELKTFESILRLDAAAGNTLESTLKNLAQGSDIFGKGITNATRALLEHGNAQQSVQRSIEGTRKGVADLASEFQNAQKGFALGALGLGAVGGIGLQVGRQLADSLVSTLKSLTTGFAESSRETQRFAERLGISTAQARQFENLGQLAGVSTKSLEASTRILSNALEDSTGSGKKAAAALRELGIATYTLGGNAREDGQVLTDLIDKLSKVADPTERARLAFVTLGRGAKEIMPLIDELDELKKRLATLGISYDNDIIAKGAEADKAFRATALSFKYLKDTLGEKIAPIAIRFSIGLANVINGKNSTPTPADLEQASAAALFPGLDVAGVLASKAPTAPSLGQADAGYASSFRNRIANTPAGLQNQIKDLNAKNTLLANAISSGDLSTQSASQKDAEYKANSTQIDDLQRRLDALKDATKATEELSNATEELHKRQLEQATESSPTARALINAVGDVKSAPASLRAGYAALGTQNLDKTATAESLKYMQDQADQIQKISDAAINGQVRIFQKNLSIVDKDLSSEIEKSKQVLAVYDAAVRSRVEGQSSDIKDAASRASRLAGIQGDEDNPLAIAQKQAQIEKDAAQQVYNIRAAHKDIFDIIREGIDLQRAWNDQDLKIQEQKAAILKAQREGFASTFASGASAIFSGGGENFLKGLGKSLETKVLTNLGSMIFDSPTTQGALSSIRVGSSGPLAGLLKGTPFGPNPLGGNSAQMATQSNTAATIDNTTALQNLTQLTAQATGTPYSGPSTGDIGSVGSAGASGVPSIGAPNLFGLSTLQSTLANWGAIDTADASTGLASSAGFGTDAMGNQIPNIAMTSAQAGDMSSFNAATGASFSALSKSANAYADSSDDDDSNSAATDVAAGAGLAASGYAAYSGIRQLSNGGARNDIGGAGQLAGAASGALGALSLLGVATGPAAPIFAGVAAIAGLVSSLFGDPKVNRENAIKKELGNSAYEAPTALNETVSSNGNYVDYDQNGNLRTSGFSGRNMVTQPYQSYRNGTFYPAPGTTVSPFQNPDLGIPVQQAGAGQSPTAAASNPTPTMSVTINALDSKSIVDRAGDIAAAWNHALQNHGEGQRSLQLINTYQGR